MHHRKVKYIFFMFAPVAHVSTFVIVVLGFSSFLCDKTREPFCSDLITFKSVVITTLSKSDPLGL